MLRQGYNRELKKLDLLVKAHKLISKKDNENLEKLKEFWEGSESYKKILEEQDELREVENFLSEEIAVFQSDTKLEHTNRNDELFNRNNFIKDTLFDLEHMIPNYYYEKFKDDDRILGLYYECCSVFDKIFDKKHFEELVKYYDRGLFIPDVKEAKYFFTILDKEYEEKRDFNEYKITIICDNGLELEIFHNKNTSYFESVKVYSKNYEEDYEFIGTHIKQINTHFNLLKMGKNLYTGKENKSYKVYLK